ncbi:unnamed protein product [Leuciscus chuanchicus]
MRADKGEQHTPNMKQAPGQQPALFPSGKMEPKSLFSLHKALAQPVKMCMFDFPVSILDDLLKYVLTLRLYSAVFVHVGLEPVRTLNDGPLFSTVHTVPCH